MGMYDEVGIQCPACRKSFIYQSKAGACSLASYSLETAPLMIVADVNDEGKRGRLYCEHCGVQIEVAVKFITTVQAKGSDGEPEHWREE